MSHGESRQVQFLFFLLTCNKNFFWILNLTSTRFLWFLSQWISSDSTNGQSHYLTFLPTPLQYSKNLQAYIFFWFHVRIKITAFVIKWNYHTLVNASENENWWTRDLCNLNVKLFFKTHFSSIRTEGGSKNHSQSRKKRVPLWPESHLCTFFVFRKVSQGWLGEDLTQADSQSSEIC